MMFAWTVTSAAILGAIVLALLLLRAHRRTRALATEADALRREVGELASASHARSRFLAMMSHEIRTPLAGIIGFGEALTDENLTPGGRRAVESIQRASQSLQALLGDILDFSRIDAGALPMQRVPTDLDALLQEVRDEFAPQARQRGLAFGLSVSDDARRWTETDPLRLRQIVVNLISNAIRYTDSGMVQVAATTRPDAPDLVVIRVTDTGFGIAPEDRQRIFDAFAQAADSETLQNSDRGGGVGLGLAIADGLVRAMGGSITVDSTPGEGSTFTVALPMPACPVPQRAAKPVDAAPSGEPANILLVDDVEMNRELFAAMLVRAGHRVTSAADGETALRLIGENAFDLAFIDIQMPFMDGIELTRRIRASTDPSTAGLPIVGLSAAAYGEDRDRAAAAGMNDYVTKPATREDIAAAVARTQVRVRAGRPADAPATGAPATAAKAEPPSPLDRSAFEVQRATFGDERLRHFLALLAAELARRLSAIDDAAARDARAEVGQHAHAIASASGNLGFRPLMQLSRAVERDVATMSAEAFSTALAELRRSTAEVVDMIDGLQIELGGEPGDRHATG